MDRSNSTGDISEWKERRTEIRSLCSLCR